MHTSLQDSKSQSQSHPETSEISISQIHLINRCKNQRSKFYIHITQTQLRFNPSLCDLKNVEKVE